MKLIKNLLRCLFYGLAMVGITLVILLIAACQEEPLGEQLCPRP